MIGTIDHTDRSLVIHACSKWINQILKFYLAPPELEQSETKFLTALDSGFGLRMEVNVGVRGAFGLGGSET